MKIGFLIISRGWAGGEVVVYNLIKSLLLSQVSVSIYLNDELKIKYADLKGLSIYSLGPLNETSKLSLLLSYRNLRSKLMQVLVLDHPSLIHAHLGGSMYLYWRLFEKFPIPLLFTLHGQEIDNYYRNKYPLATYLLKNILQKAHRVFSPSQWQILALEPKFKGKTIVIPNGVDTRDFVRNKSKRSRYTVLFVGRLVEGKGIPELIQVARLLPHINFLFVGQGPLSNLINLPNTFRLGFKTRPELIDLYNQSTICCLPSVQESFCNVGLEAMACACPVITTYRGFSEYVRHNRNGIMIKNNNPIQIKRAIQKLMASPTLRKRLAMQGRKTAQAFDWSLIAARYNLIYKKICLENNR